MARIKPSVGSGLGYDPNEGIYYGINKNGFGGVKSIFVKGKPIASKVTPQLSLCFGVCWLGYYTKRYGYDYDKGVSAYNGGGNPNYLQDVKDCKKDVKGWLRKKKEL